MEEQRLVENLPTKLPEIHRRVNHVVWEIFLLVLDSSHGCRKGGISVEWTETSSPESKMAEKLPPVPRLGFAQLRFLIAAVLLLAAGLKAYQIATAPLPPVVQGSVFTPFLELLNDRYFLMAVVIGEILFALILIADICRAWAWLLSLLGFSVFALVSLVKGLVGESDCGCWGTFAVNPYITMSFDLVIVALLLVFRERITWAFPVVDRKKLAVLLIVWSVLAGPVLFAILSLKQRPYATLGTEFTGPDGKTMILLEPKKWIGEEFPLFSRFTDPEGAETLKQGEWNILLVQPDCPTCKQMINDLEARNAENVAIVVVPSSSNEREVQTIFPVFKPDNQNDWLVSPCVVKTVDGICEEINEKIDEN